MNEILYEDNHIIVVNKKPNIPVQADDSEDEDLLTIIKKYIKNKYNKPGNVYVGLIHRLDRPVSGVMVFAKTSKAASRLSEQIRNHTFKKTYYAIVEGKIKFKKGTFEDYLLKNEKTNVVKVDSKGKLAILNYEVIKETELLSLVKIDLITGRSHQIRVQFSHHGHPLYGDQKYNPNAIKNKQIKLLSKQVSFIHPTTKEILSFEVKIPNDNIWESFNNN